MVSYAYGALDANVHLTLKFLITCNLRQQNIRFLIANPHFIKEDLFQMLWENIFVFVQG